MPLIIKHKFTFPEKELVLENERMKRCGSISKKGRVPSKLDALLRTTEDERDHYREQNEILEKLLRGDSGSCPSPIRSRSSSSSSSSSNRVVSLSNKNTISRSGSPIRGHSSTKVKMVSLD